MPLIEMNWDPSIRQLKQFGWICLIAMPSIGWFVGASPKVLLILVAIGVTFGSVAIFVPKLLRPIFIAISLASAPIGMLCAEVAMLLLFFGVFLPIGLILRLAKYDPLRRTFSRKAKTYWEPKRSPKNTANYFRQS